MMDIEYWGVESHEYENQGDSSGPNKLASLRVMFVCIALYTIYKNCDLRDIRVYVPALFAHEVDKFLRVNKEYTS